MTSTIQAIYIIPRFLDFCSKSKDNASGKYEVDRKSIATSDCAKLLDSVGEVYVVDI
jgi:hypothetical protein